MLLNEFADHVLEWSRLLMAIRSVLSRNGRIKRKNIGFVFGDDNVNWKIPNIGHWG